ncbi:juvenile hormone esterase isoform X2 [Zeugodacus cucurbitae]|uniref:Carboxylic ester hydrolase n=1 Tax=Zeugodacus cucurbitae TaxID=28588 RepID=A0A0A1X822_ZEUCU|nr:juvenile hormone esterase isoform X2 [Zeugodacus cucurbitae]
MTSIKLQSLFNIIYYFVLINCLINVKLSFSTANIDETVTIVFEDQQQRKITVAGVHNKSWTNADYYAFRGIPYVKPPVQELRFKDPQPLHELPSYIDARYDGHDCPSIYATNASEDCLTLNIYTPTTTDTAKLPVLVFIHPGGLYIGSSLSTFISPAYLLAKPIVLVSFNYRLGTLGFLQLGTREIPGNAGFKDQVYAMRWVQKYIKHFGGNPEDITLMGYSAGALSVNLHLVSPMSRGLFHKAIIMSGSLPPQTVLPQHTQLELLRKQARVLNCTEVSSELELLNCLQKFNARVEHMDDLMYLFEINASKFNRNESSNASMIRLYTKFIYDFVKSGSSLFSKLPTYPAGYTKIYRSLEYQPGYIFAKDTYEMWKRLFHLDDNKN